MGIPCKDKTMSKHVQECKYVLRHHKKIPSQVHLIWLLHLIFDFDFFFQKITPKDEI